MSALHEAQLLLAKMTRAEKAALLQEVAQVLGDAFPGIESREGICGGEPCIVRTRIPVWILHRMRKSGMTDAGVLQAYPTLFAEDLANAWHYIRAHQAEIEQQARNNDDA